MYFQQPCVKTYFKYFLYLRYLIQTKEKLKVITQRELNVSVRTEGETATVFAGDYLNKLTGEKIERECRRQLEAGCKELIVDFSDTEIVNSIGVSILLGVIDSATNAGARVVFSDVNEDTVELFDMLGLTSHVTLQN